MDRNEISAELRRVQSDFDQLVSRATAADLVRRSAGTRWTNRQLLYHMVFGYLIVRTLMPLVHLLGCRGWSRRFATVLNACRGPFHAVNYLGRGGGGQIVPPAATVTLMERTLRALR